MMKIWLLPFLAPGPGTTSLPLRVEITSLALGLAPAPTASARAEAIAAIAMLTFIRISRLPSASFGTTVARLNIVPMEGPNDGFDAKACIERLAPKIAGAVGELGRRGAVVAVSGGVDSGVVAGLCCRALGPERVLCL